jgi:TonB family protein
MSALTSRIPTRLAACVALTIAAFSSLPRAADAQAPPAAANAQTAPELSGLTISAAQVAQELDKRHAKNVAVFDFINPDATGWDAVGRAVAEDFRAKLDATNHTFNQIKYSKIAGWINRDHLQPGDLAIADVAASAIRGAKVDAFVIGFLSPNANATTLKLAIRVYDPRKSDPVAITATIWLTPELAALRAPESKPIPPLPLSGAESYSAPACVSCPAAPYTQEALDRKFDGMVVLFVTVEPDGRAGKIELYKGAPYGLTAEAIGTVRGWHFTPAHDRNGKPIAVRQMIEVQFHLY